MWCARLAAHDKHPRLSPDFLLSSKIMNSVISNTYTGFLKILIIIIYFTKGNCKIFFELFIAMAHLDLELTSFPVRVCSWKKNTNKYEIIHRNIQYTNWRYNIIYNLLKFQKIKQYLHFYQHFSIFLLSPKKYEIQSRELLRLMYFEPDHNSSNDLWIHCRIIDYRAQRPFYPSLHEHIWRNQSWYIWHQIDTGSLKKKRNWTPNYGIPIYTTRRTCTRLPGTQLPNAKCLYYQVINYCFMFTATYLLTSNCGLPSMYVWKSLFKCFLLRFIWYGLWRCIYIYI